MLWAADGVPTGASSVDSAQPLFPSSINMGGKSTAWHSMIRRIVVSEILTSVDADKKRDDEALKTTLYTLATLLRTAEVAEFVVQTLKESPLGSNKRSVLPQLESHLDDCSNQATGTLEGDRMLGSALHKCGHCGTSTRPSFAS